MIEAVIVALITGILALIGTIIAANQSSKRADCRIEELRADFTNLSEQVNEHNALVERIEDMEQSNKSAHHHNDALEVRR